MAEMETESICGGAFNEGEAYLPELPFKTTYIVTLSKEKKSEFDVADSVALFSSREYASLFIHALADIFKDDEILQNTLQVGVREMREAE